MCGYNEFNGGVTAEVLPLLLATCPEEDEDKDEDEDEEDDVRAAMASDEIPWRAGEEAPLAAAEDDREDVVVVAVSVAGAPLPPL